MIIKLHLINFQLFPKILLSLITLLASSVNLVKAQHIPPTVINGLFTPTESDRFFQEGRRKFDAKTRVLDNAEHYFDNDILDISPEVLRQEQEKQYHDFREENSILIPFHE